MKNVIIYTTMMCPYCHRAKAMLQNKGVAFEEIDVTFDQRGRADMTAKSGGRTSVPQIWIGGDHVGGSDDLMALERAGRLDAMLAERESGSER